MGHFLKNIDILSAKGATFRCLLMDISKNKIIQWHMTEEYCKCKYSISLKVLVISHFSFLIGVMN